MVGEQPDQNITLHYISCKRSSLSGSRRLEPIPIGNGREADTVHHGMLNLNLASCLTANSYLELYTTPLLYEIWLRELVIWQSTNKLYDGKASSAWNMFPTDQKQIFFKENSLKTQTNESHVDVLDALCLFLCIFWCCAFVFTCFHFTCLILQFLVLLHFNLLSYCCFVSFVWTPERLLTTLWALGDIQWVSK